MPENYKGIQKAYQKLKNQEIKKAKCLYFRHLANALQDGLEPEI